MKTLFTWFKNNWLFSTKLIVLVVSIWFLYDKLILDKGWEGFLNLPFDALLNHPTFWGVIGLMFINWGIEAFKWKLLVNRFEAINYFTAIKSVVTGVFISLFVNILVPNRLGEFAGRILYVRINKIKAALISSIGSFAQFIVTALFGAVAYVVLWFTYSQTPENKYLSYLLVGAVVLIIALIVLLYFNINVLSWLLEKPKLIKRFKKITSVFYFYSTVLLSKVFALSVIRYFVFCVQFILLLNLCGVDIRFTEGLIAIPVIFLVQTVVPSNALSNLGVRGAASIHFLNYFSANDAGILAAAYLLWVINILVPGLAGAIFFSIFKFRKANGNGH